MNFFLSLLPAPICSCVVLIMNLFSTFDGTQKILITDINFIMLGRTGHGSMTDGVIADLEMTHFTSTMNHIKVEYGQNCIKWFFFFFYMKPLLKYANFPLKYVLFYILLQILGLQISVFFIFIVLFVIKKRNTASLLI